MSDEQHTDTDTGTDEQHTRDALAALIAEKIEQLRDAAPDERDAAAASLARAFSDFRDAKVASDEDALRQRMARLYNLTPEDIETYYPRGANIPEERAHRIGAGLRRLHRGTQRTS